MYKGQLKACKKGTKWEKVKRKICIRVSSRSAKMGIMREQVEKNKHDEAMVEKHQTLLAHPSHIQALSDNQTKPKPD